MALDVKGMKSHLEFILHNLDENSASHNVLESAGVVVDDKVDFVRLNSLEQSTKMFFLNDSLPGQNIEVARKMIEAYVKVIEDGRKILLATPQYKYIHEKIKEFEELIIAKYNELQSSFDSIKEKQYQIRLLIDILNKKEYDLNELNIEKVIGVIEELDLDIIKKKELLFFVYKTVSDKIALKIEEKEDSKRKIIERKRKESLSERLQKRSEVVPVVPVEKKIDSFIRDIINKSDDFKKRISDNEIDEELLTSRVLGRILFFPGVTEHSFDVDEEKVKELIDDEIITTEEENILERYDSIILSDEGLFAFARDYISDIDIVASYCEYKEAEFTVPAIKRCLEEIFINRTRKNIDNIKELLDTIRLIINDEWDAIKEKIESKGINAFNVDKILSDISETLKIKNIDINRIDYIEKTIEEMFIYLSENIDLLYKYSNGLNSEESERFIDLVYIISFVKELNDILDLGEDLIYSPNESSDILGIVALINQNPDLNNYMERKIEESTYDQPNPFKKVLFMSELGKDIADPKNSNYLKAFGKTLYFAEALARFHAPTMNAHSFNKDRGEYSAKLAEKKIIVCRPQYNDYEARVFISKVEFVSDDGKREDRYVIVLLDKKLQNGTNADQNEKNCVNVVESNLEEFNKLVALAKYGIIYVDEKGKMVPEDTPGSKKYTYEEEIEKQRKLANKIFAKTKVKERGSY